MRGVALPSSWHHNLRQPDEAREYPRGKTEVVRRGGILVARSTFQPGWRWSDDVGPLKGEPSCRRSHTGYLVSGRLRVLLDAGEELELSAGDVYVIDSGHDSWTVGDDPCVSIEFSFMSKEENHESY